MTRDQSPKREALAQRITAKTVRAALRQRGETVHLKHLQYLCKGTFRVSEVQGRVYRREDLGLRLPAGRSRGSAQGEAPAIFRGSFVLLWLWGRP